MENIINDVRFSSSDAAYRMLCSITNHLSEGIRFENQSIEPLESSIVSIREDRIQLTPFPANINQLISDIRSQLPKHIFYTTVDSVTISFVEFPID